MSQFTNLNQRTKQLIFSPQEITKKISATLAFVTGKLIAKMNYLNIDTTLVLKKQILLACAIQPCIMFILPNPPLLFVSI